MQNDRIISFRCDGDFMELADAHLHSGPGNGYSDFGELKSFVKCTSVPGEWAVSGDPRASVSYGVHPWYCSEWNADVRDMLADRLGREPEANVGEIGLDSRRGLPEEQMESFEEQLREASCFGRVASVHNIGCDKMVLDSIRRHGKGCRGIILHSFCSDSYIKPFSSLNCYFSLNPRILSRSPARISRLVNSIPENRILFESDSPFYNSGFAGMGRFITEISEISGLEPDYMSETAAENLRRLTGERKHLVQNRDPRGERRNREAPGLFGGALRMRRGRRVRVRGSGARRRRPHKGGRQRRFHPEQSQPADTGYK